ncbi:HNH endonuclease signature motif containing protein [Corynebacterium tapiri]|uniref:HNH nuclease domain-containing protein n=1 Tax=Corynebacterium tapiri TaxID=1448266 RepID=A0A5C4U5H0_9CORY|nr:HNH endonuclease signature motif containing protein [Corynebacterium tapiri]TNL98447.1 hypothetical protein FHE74_04405 [Corynebacterium tapiri]
MTALLTQLAQLLKRGVDIVSAVHDSATEIDDLAYFLGLKTETARAIVRLSNELHKPLKNPIDEAQRQESLELYTRHSVSIFAMLEIAKAARKIPDQRESIRLEISRQAPGLSVKELIAVGRDVVAKRRPNPTDHAFQQRTARFSRNVDADGCRTLLLRLPEPVMSEVMNRVNSIASARFDRSGGPRFDQLAADAFVELFRAGAGPSPALAPSVVITDRDLVGHVSHGSVALTDGTTMPLAEFINKRIATSGWAMAYGDGGTPLAVGRIHRFATPAQRAALAAHQLTCAAPGCGFSAAECQAHHIVAWADGGSTDILNLALLCPRHHAQVGTHLSRGDDGELYWDGHPNRLPVRRLSARQLALAA